LCFKNQAIALEELIRIRYNRFGLDMIDQNKEKIFIRLASKDDLSAIQTLMKESMQVLGQGHYSTQQIQSCCQYVCVPDLRLIEDQTFFVVTTGPEKTIVGCGGWSFRKTLYAGPSAVPQKEDERLNPERDFARIRAMFVSPFQSGKGIGSKILSASEQAARAYGFKKGILGATLSRLAFYQSKGWISTRTEQTALPDGVVIDVVTMEKELCL
jgi:GNAT superfamily N-acetyltransferase